MRNRFKGTCFRCGKTVQPFEGHFQVVSKSTYKKYGWSDTKWLTQHAECAIKYRDTNIHYLKNPDKEVNKSC